MMYALFIVAPLARVDGAIICRLFGGTTNSQLPFVGEQEPRGLVSEWP